MYTAMARCDIPSDWIANFSQCLYEWQGIAAGVLALLAAGLGGYFLHRQISQNERHEVERLARQHKAVRATLPLALSGLCETMNQMLLALNEAKVAVGEHGFVSDFDLPATPDEHLRELQAIILSTDKACIAEPIAKIIRELQILWSRAEVLQSKAEQKQRAGLGREINNWIIQAAKIYALVESLFEYSRSETEEGPSEVAWERAESIIFRLSIEDSDLRNEIKQSVAKSAYFWTLYD